MSDSFVVFLQTQGSPKELSEAFGKVGLHSEGFADPRAFLKRVKDGVPMASFIDLSFDDAPVMLAMLKSIRTVLGSQLPLIAFASPADKTMDAKARAVGATEVLYKPFDEDELISTVAKHAAAPDTEVIEVPKLVKWFFEKLAPALAGLSGVLSDGGDAESQIHFYEQRLHPHREMFVNLISAMRKTEAKAELNQCIRMYGVRNTRNLVVAMKLSSLTATPLVGWNSKTGMLAGEPTQALKFATQTFEHFGEGSRNQSEAFNSGLVLDLLIVLADATGSRKAVLRKFIEERYSEAIKQADKSIAAAKSAQRLVLDRHIVTTLLMREAGKAAMAIFYPDYLELRRKFDKRSLHPALQHIVELRQFSVSHNLMGALVCQGGPGLAEAYKSVLFFDYPYMLESVADASDSYDLIRVCNQV